MERLSSPQFLGKLQALKEDRRITERLRTQLRHLLLTEMHNGPSARWNPVITVRGRALGSLIVEWLRIHDCHYTMSVLASEIPSLADLPGFAGDDPECSLKKREAEEILLTLEMKSKRIIDEYESSSESLLSCIMKVAASWKARLQFMEIPTAPNPSDQATWNTRLRHLVASSCLDPKEMPGLFAALNDIIHTEVEKRVDHEKRNAVTENLARESKVREQLRRLEEFWSISLNRAQDEISKSKEKTHKELLEEKRALCELIADINQQHKVVLDGLQDLEMREQKLEAAQQAWKTEVEFEKQRRKRISQDLANRITQFEQEKELFERNKKLQENLRQNSIPIVATTTSALSKTTEPVIALQIEENSGESPNKITKTSSQGRLKTTGKISSDGRSCSPLLNMSDHSNSSIESPSQSSGATAAAWARLKELREETKRKSEEFYERRIELCSDSDSPPPESSVHQTGNTTFRVLRDSQATFPTLHEGCHNESPATDRQPSNTRRYRHLLAQGDHKIRRSSLQTRIPRMPDVSSSKGPDACRRIRYQADRLNNLIQSARQSSPEQASVRSGAKAWQEKAKEKKLEVLLHSVRDSPRIDNGVDSTIRSNEASEAVMYPQPEGDTRAERSEIISEREASPKKASRIPISAGTTPDLTLKRKIEHQAGPSSITQIPTEEADLMAPGQRVLEEGEEVALRENSGRTSRPSSLPVRKDARPPLQRTYTMPPTSLLHATLDSSSPLSDGEVISIGQSGGDFWS